MSVAISKPMSLEAFLEWEERQELRYEFDGFEPSAMTGGTVRAFGDPDQHLRSPIGGRLRGRPCRLFSSDLKILVAGSIRYPDAFVVCTPVPARRNGGDGTCGRVRSPEPEHRKH